MELRKERVEFVDREEHLRRINESPAKHTLNQYLSQPREFALPVPTSPSAVEHQTQYGQPGRLRENFLRQAVRKERHGSVETKQLRWNQQIRTNPSVHDIHAPIPKSRSKIFDSLPFSEVIARQNAPPRVSVSPPPQREVTPPKLTHKKLALSPNTITTHAQLTPPLKPSYAIRS